jgi:hypothetical protein
MQRRKELWGLLEAADALAVSDKTLRRWADTDPTFPEPEARLRIGDVYDARDIRTWHRRRVAEKRKQRAF